MTVEHVPYEDTYEEPRWTDGILTNVFVFAVALVGLFAILGLYS